MFADTWHKHLRQIILLDFLDKNLFFCWMHNVLIVVEKLWKAKICYSQMFRMLDYMKQEKEKATFYRCSFAACLFIISWINTQYIMYQQKDSQWPVYIPVSSQIKNMLCSDLDTAALIRANLNSILNYSAKYE